jgi:hypothetical protein
MTGAEQSTGSIRQPRRPSLVEQARERGTRAFESDETYALDGVWEWMVLHSWGTSRRPEPVAGRRPPPRLPTADSNPYAALLSRSKPRQLHRQVAPGDRRLQLPTTTRSRRATNCADEVFLATGPAARKPRDHALL